MPCYEVRTLSIEFKAAHRDLLEQALKNLGWQYRFIGTNRLSAMYGDIMIDLDAEKATVNEYMQGHLNELKRAYSSAAIDRVAKKNRWKRRAKTPTKGVLRRM